MTNFLKSGVSPLLTFIVSTILFIPPFRASFCSSVSSLKVLGDLNVAPESGIVLLLLFSKAANSALYLNLYVPSSSFSANPFLTSFSHSFIAGCTA